MSENGSEILRIDAGIVAIPLFGIDVPTSSKGIGLGTQFSRSEADNEVELGKEFGPSDLASGEESGCGEIFQVLVVRNDIDWTFRSF